MTDLSKYEGIIPAFYACYDDAGEVDATRTKVFARYLADKGVKGLYVGGSSGECIYQNPHDRTRTLEAVMESVGDRLTIIAHVACNNTKDSCALAAHAESLGVDAIAAIPPIYFPLSVAAIGAYWQAMSDAAPNTDMVLYNIPQFAGTALTRPLYEMMLQNPRVIGVKNSSMSTYDIEQWVRLGGADHIVFNGPDEQLASGLVAGARGGIGGTYAVMPEAYMKIYSYVKEGRLDLALQIQHECNQVIELLCAGKGHLDALMKEVLRRRDGIELGGVRAPLPKYEPSDKILVDQVIERLDHWS